MWLLISLLKLNLTFSRRIQNWNWLFSIAIHLFIVKKTVLCRFFQKREIYTDWKNKIPIRTRIKDCSKQWVRKERSKFKCKKNQHTHKYGVKEFPILLVCLPVLTLGIQNICIQFIINYLTATLTLLIEVVTLSWFWSRRSWRLLVLVKLLA